MPTLNVAPVLFLVFNRPDTTAKVFEVIREARPPKLYVAADGPRLHKEGEAERCETVRKIVSDVDWPCEVHTLFRSENLGCGKGVSGAITWFFEHEPEGIILEDDCYPAQDFFRYCTELLERYRHDNRVMIICGSNLLQTMPKRDDNQSYFFSNHDYIWGWASWRRAWNHYDYKISSYPQVKDKGYFNAYHNSIYEADYMKFMYDKIYYQNETLTWWDYQWVYARRVNSGISIVPFKNLIINLGVGNEATNTVDSNGLGSDLQLEKMMFPLKHPEFMMIDQVTDDKVFKKYFTSRRSRVKSKIKAVVPVEKIRPVYKAAAAMVTQLFEVL